MPVDLPGHLPLTGERTVPGVWHETYWFQRHVAGYLAVTPWARGVALEAGCGEGYGARLLRAAGAAAVVALDYDVASVRHVASAYSSADPSVAAVRANLVALPLAAASVDVVASLQVVEHIWTPDELLAECARVLRPGGRLLLTTPNRLTFSPGLGRGAKPLNPFHVREYDGAELAEGVGRHLRVERLLGLHHGPRLTAWEQVHGSLVAAQQAGAPSSWPSGLADLVRSVQPADFEVSEELDGSLDLVVVARRDP